MEQETGKVKEITILKAVYEMKLNPENVFYTRVSDKAASENHMLWTTYSPFYNAGLLPFGQHEISLILRKKIQNLDGTEGDETPWENDQGIDKISMKEGFPFYNSVNNATLTINGNLKQYANVRKWANELLLMMGGKRVKDCNTSGGKYHSLNGMYPTFEDFDNGNHIDMPFNVPKWDENLLSNEQEFITRLLDSNNQIMSFTPNMTYKFNENIIFPPFNPLFLMSCCCDNLPKDCWFRNMTKSIPHINRIDYELNMTKLIESLLLYRFSYIDDIGNYLGKLEINSISSSNLLLYWYKYPDVMNIPKEISINSWYYKIFDHPIGTVTDGTTAILNTNSFELHNIPNYIFIYAKRIFNSSDYLCASMNGRSNDENRQSNAGILYDSREVYLSIKSLDITMSNKTQVINTSLTTEQLYQLTLKNINYKDFPYDYQKWKGRATFGTADLARGGGTPNNNPSQTTPSDQIVKYPGKCIIVLKPYDLGISDKTGTYIPKMTIRLSNLQYTAFSSFPSTYLDKNYSYNLYLSTFYSNEGFNATQRSFVSFET